LSLKSLIVVITGILFFQSLSYAETKTLSPQQPLKPQIPIVDTYKFRYKHNSVTMFHYNKGNDEFWIFEPNNPEPKKAPVIVFNHGWMAMTPSNYGAWIDHIVKRRNIVIFPRYQKGLMTPPKNLTYNAIKAVKNAILILQTEKGHVKPDLSRFAVVGHSVGGIISANMGAIANKEGLPTPRSIMCVLPGVTWKKAEGMNIPLENLAKINKNTLLLTIAGDKDRVVKNIDAKRIFKESTKILLKNKNYILLRSDEHGFPPLIANHFTASSPVSHYNSLSKKNGEIKTIKYNGESPKENEKIVKTKTSFQERRVIDALDYYGLWKLFDGLTDAAFYNKNREYGLGNTDKQRFMGAWSDGTPVKEIDVRTNL